VHRCSYVGLNCVLQIVFDDDDEIDDLRWSEAAFQAGGPA